MNKVESGVFLGLSLMGSVLLPGCGLNSDPNALPSGYEWKKCNNIQASFPAPVNWRVVEQDIESDKVCFIAENPTGDTIPETGLIAAASQNFEPPDNTPIDEHMKHIMRSNAARVSLDQLQPVKMGHLSGYRRQFGSFFPKGDAPFHEYVQVLYNDQTRTLYLIRFGSLESKWSQSLNQATLTLDKPLIDENY